MALLRTKLKTIHQETCRYRYNVYFPSDKTNISNRLYVDSLPLKRHFIHRIGIEAHPGYIFPTNSFFRGENLNWKPIENSLSLHLKHSFQFHPNTYTDHFYRGAYQGIGMAYYNMYEKLPRHISYDLVLFSSWRRKGITIGEGQMVASPEAYPVLGFRFNNKYPTFHRR